MVGEIHGGDFQETSPLTGKELSRVNIGRALVKGLDSGPWATIELSNGMIAYDPVDSLNVFDKDGNPVNPNDPIAVIKRRQPTDYS